MRAAFLLVVCGVLAGCGRPGAEWVRADGKTTSSLEALHGTGPQDIWAVGELGTVIHWNGTAWSVMDTGTKVDLHAVWAVDRANAWAVGEQGVVLRWNGASWSRVDVGSDDKLTGVWASGPSDVWVVEDSLSSGGLLRFDGKTWTRRSVTGSSSTPVRVWGSGPNDVWVTLEYRDELMHWTGAGWTAERPDIGAHPWCEDLGAGGDGELLTLCKVVTEKRVVLKGPGGWKLLPMDEATLEASYYWAGIWGAGSELWAVGEYGRVHHFDGKEWTEELGEDLDVPDLKDVWGSSGADVWAVGDEGLVIRRTPAESD
ncbi:hypothetical protein JRI60_00095 [Archangium violaceum]|uniref:WD40/YVTN/BNR-like repeat-containing protein n=1 Tax=Archangium violaceum TaxID=83451 RepID=UPI00195233B3|nr:hypothetical protein [Archangium violaceum]QRN97532.1 hypothetical protein JRI60_00095 [Archangium violaceum]